MIKLLNFSSWSFLEAEESKGVRLRVPSGSEQVIDLKQGEETVLALGGLEGALTLAREKGAVLVRWHPDVG